MTIMWKIIRLFGRTTVVDDLNVACLAFFDG